MVYLEPTGTLLCCAALPPPSHDSQLPSSRRVPPGSLPAAAWGHQSTMRPMIGLDQAHLLTRRIRGGRMAVARAARGRRQGIIEILTALLCHVDSREASGRRAYCGGDKRYGRVAVEGACRPIRWDALIRWPGISGPRTDSGQAQGRQAVQPGGRPNGEAKDRVRAQFLQPPRACANEETARDP